MMRATEGKASTEHLPIRSDDEMLTWGMNPPGLRQASSERMKTGW
jgi:hypothetical protein